MVEAFPCVVGFAWGVGHSKRRVEGQDGVWNHRSTVSEALHEVGLEWKMALKGYAVALGVREGCADVATGAWAHVVEKAVFGRELAPEWDYEAAAAWVDLGMRN